MKRIGLVVASILLGGGLAIAQTPEKIAEHWFNQGNTAYNLARYDEAASNFTKAYEAWPQPEFLYNIAQSYRLGGNCKQALHFYKRFKSLKENLPPKKREEVDRFIKELTDCAAKADKTAGSQPDTIDRPPPGATTTNPTTNPTTTNPTTTNPTTTNPTTTNPTTTNPTTTQPKTTTQPTTTVTTTPKTTVTQPPTTTTTGTNTTTVTPPNKDTAALEPTDEGEEEIEEGDGPGVSKSADLDGPTLLSARMTFGVALLGSRELNIPVQPSVGIAGGYPLPLGKLTLELGAGLSWTPLPYENADGQQRGTMLGVRAVVGAVYPVAPKVLLRGDLGIGIIQLAGLAEGNPITDMRQAQSFTLPSFRFGVSADYVVTPNVVAYASPFGIAFSPGNDQMYGGGLREINLLVGVGYQR